MGDRLIDAILVARDLQKRYPEIYVDRLPRHNLSDDNPLAVKGVAVREKVDGSILTAVKDSCAKSQGIDSFGITIIPVPAETVSVVIGDDGKPKSGDKVMRSILLRYANRAEIRYVDNLNECWKRFVICKELSHLIMYDEQGARASNVSEQLALAYAICNDARPDRDLSGEQFAWFVAAELMLPIADRAELMERKANGETTLSIARSYHTPSAIVSMLFETPYGLLSNERPEGK